jgi:hypothetical protein
MHPAQHLPARNLVVIRRVIANQYLNNWPVSFRPIGSNGGGIFDFFALLMAQLG